MRSRYRVSWRMRGSTWRKPVELRAGVPASGGRSGRVGRDADFQRGGAGVVGERGAVLAGQASTPRMRRTATSPVASVHGSAERADVRPGLVAARQQLRVRARRLRGLVFVRDAMPAALLAQVFAQQLAGARIEHTHDAAIPLHLARCGRSSPAARCSRRLRLRRSRPGSRVRSPNW